MSSDYNGTFKKLLLIWNWGLIGLDPFKDGLRFPMYLTGQAQTRDLGSVMHQDPK